MALDFDLEDRAEVVGAGTDGVVFKNEGEAIGDNVEGAGDE